MVDCHSPKQEYVILRSPSSTDDRNQNTPRYYSSDRTDTMRTKRESEQPLTGILTYDVKVWSTSVKFHHSSLYRVRSTNEDSPLVFKKSWRTFETEYNITSRITVYRLGVRFCLTLSLGRLFFLAHDLSVDRLWRDKSKEDGNNLLKIYWKETMD